MLIVWQLMTSVYVELVPVQPFASVAVTVIGKLPVVLVVPESTPVDVPSVMPGGSAPVSVQPIVPLPPDCVNAWLKSVPAVPVVVDGLVTVMTLQAIVSV